MVNKKDDDNDDKHDFTSIGDMTEFLHPEDHEAELKFKQLNGEMFPEKEETFEEPLQELSIDELPDEVIEELPPDLPPEVIEDTATFNEEFTADFSEETPLEENFDSSLVEDIEISMPDDENLEPPLDEIIDTEIKVEAEEESFEQPIEPETYKAPENFKEVQNFAQNFSYGEIPAGGNPPFSIILKNIKFQEDAENILALLNEYKISNPDNEKDFRRSIEFGSLLIPQIGEYLAIILTHKLRRFDCSIEMGLSDQIQASKSGGPNPRGLISKSHIHQNKSEKVQLEKDDISINEIIVSTTSTLIGHKITKYLGVETAFRLIEVEDLERLHFIQRSLSEAMQSLDIEVQTDYSDFVSNFHQIYTDLINELKECAFKKNSNAILGVTYNLTPFLSEKQATQNKYQLTCTGTLVSVIQESSTEEDETL